MAETEQHRERPPINTLNMWALSLAMLSFVIPLLLSVPAIVLGLVNRSRLDGDGATTTMNRKLAGLAVVTGLFTAFLAAIYFIKFGFS